MIEIRNLQKVIEQNTALDLPEIIVPAGEIAAVVGPAGSGKARLLDLLLGKTRPTVGVVRVAEAGSWIRNAGPPYP